MTKLRNGNAFDFLCSKFELARRLEVSVVDVRGFGDPCIQSHGPISYRKGSGRLL